MSLCYPTDKADCPLLGKCWETIAILKTKSIPVEFYIFVVAQKGQTAAVYHVEKVKPCHTFTPGVLHWQRC